MKIGLTITKSGKNATETRERDKSTTKIKESKKVTDR
jgi:hypothetical protein